MKIFPAIDIKDKKCVRLVKGDFDNKTEYELSPVVSFSPNLPDDKRFFSFTDQHSTDVRSLVVPPTDADSLYFMKVGCPSQIFKFRVRS